jgi:hypothetical protein
MARRATLRLTCASTTSVEREASPEFATVGGQGEAEGHGLREGELDEAQMAKWVKQAAALPGWVR